LIKKKWTWQRNNLKIVHLKNLESEGLEVMGEMALAKFWIIFYPYSGNDQQM